MDRRTNNLGDKVSKREAAQSKIANSINQHSKKISILFHMFMYKQTCVRSFLNTERRYKNSVLKSVNQFKNSDYQLVNEMMEEYGLSDLINMFNY